MGSFVRLGALVIALAPALAACAAHHSESVATDDSALLAQDGSDASDVESQTTSLTAAFTLGASASSEVTADGMVGAADRATSYFLPSGCLTVTKDATNRKVTYALDGCTGPWGLLRVSGSVVATYTQTASGATQVEVDGAGLRYNRATADYHATAVLTASGLSRTMTWQGALTGVTARGRAFKRTASWTMLWSVGASCVELDGNAEGTVLGRPIDTTVQHYVRCRGECPEADGKITVTDTSTKRSVEIDFDGTNEAKLSVMGGPATTIVLACGL